MGHKACSPGCAVEVAVRARVKKEAHAKKMERRADRAKRESLKTYPQLVAEVQKVFNEAIRLRDAGKPCICCGRTETKVDGLNSHGWDAGHYRSTGSAPHLRFNEDNVHAQLVYCNRNKAGNAVDYRIGLIARIGLERVEALESDNTPRKWTHEELRAMKAHYQAKVRELRKERA
ncbi:recombination protein NinG [Massilia endophytica]|nr:recombination protein NinG [Massilia endophytica]